MNTAASAADRAVAARKFISVYDRKVVRNARQLDVAMSYDASSLAWPWPADGPTGPQPGKVGRTAYLEHLYSHLAALRGEMGVFLRDYANACAPKHRRDEPLRVPVQEILQAHG